MKERQIDITKQDIRCCDELVINSDNIEAAYELWFDVDKYFGTDTKFDDNTWINFYTYWYPDGDVLAEYFIDSPEKCTVVEWVLTKEEKAFFLKLMEDYCQEKEGKTLAEFWESFQD